MASYEEHIKAAKHNEEIALFLLEPQCKSIPWVSITTFYAALQYIEAGFTNTSIEHIDGVKSDSDISPHKRREFYISTESRLKAISQEYKELRRASEMFRYLNGDSRYITKDTLRDFLNYNLKKIKDQLLKTKLIRSA